MATSPAQTPPASRSPSPKPQKKKKEKIPAGNKLFAPNPNKSEGDTSSPGAPLDEIMPPDAQKVDLELLVLLW